MNVSAQAKCQLTVSPALPAKCLICGQHALNGKQFVDFGLSLDDYGAVVICEDCVRGDVVPLFEFIATPAFEAMANENKSLRAIVAKKEAQISALSNLLRTFDLADSNYLDSVLYDDQPVKESETGDSVSKTAKSGSVK